MQSIQAIGSLSVAPLHLPVAASTRSPIAADAPSFQELLQASLERAATPIDQGGQGRLSSVKGAADQATAVAAATQADAALRTAMQVHESLAAAIREIKDLRM
jgi:flagellar hook-basal body complex protein FliE